MKNRWYANTNGYLGIVSEEETDKTIAVSYDVQDANLLAAAPELLEAIRIVYTRVVNMNINTPLKDMNDTWDILRQALDGKP